MFWGLPGARGGRKRTLREKRSPIQGSRISGNPGIPGKAGTTLSGNPGNPRNAGHFQETWYYEKSHVEKNGAENEIPCVKTGGGGFVIVGKTFPVILGILGRASGLEAIGALQ